MNGIWVSILAFQALCYVLKRSFWNYTLTENEILILWNVQACKQFQHSFKANVFLS